MPPLKLISVRYVVRPFNIKNILSLKLQANLICYFRFGCSTLNLTVDPLGLSLLFILTNLNIWIQNSYNFIVEALQLIIIDYGNITFLNEDFFLSYFILIIYIMVMISF